MDAALESVKKKYSEGGEEARVMAIESLRGVHTADAVGLLISALGDESWRVRKTATSALESKVGDDSFLNTLIGLLKNPDNAGLRNSAVELLVKSGAKGVGLLIFALKDPDEGVRKFAVDILGDIRDKSALPALVEALRDRDLNVKASATEALGKIGGPDTVSSLVKVLETDDDLWVRFSVLEALGRIGKGVPVEKVAVFVSDRFLRKPAMEALGSTLSVEAVKYLVDGLADKSDTIRSASVVSIMKIIAGLQAGEISNVFAAISKSVNPGPIAELFYSSSPDVIRGAVHLVGICGSSHEVKSLLKLVKDVQYHDAVKTALVAMSAKGSLAALMDEYSGADDKTRAYICAVMGDLKDRKALPILYSALSDKYGHTRSQAMVAIAKFGLLESADKLLPLLDDVYEDVSESAAKALMSIGVLHPKGFTGMLSVWGKDRSARVRKNIARVLGGLKIKESIAPLFSLMKDEDAQVRKVACVSLGKLCYPEGIEHLAMALVDESAEVKLAAVRALECFSPVSEVEKLLMLAAKDVDSWVRNAAVKGLSKYTSDGAVKTLEHVVTNDVAIVAIAAIDALAASRTPQAVSVIRRALKNKDAQVVRAAEGKLKKLSVV